MKNRIKELREAAGLTQSELGDRVGAHWQTIQRLESGSTRLDTDWMERLGGALQVSPLAIVTDLGQFRMVPVIGNVQAGAWAESYEWEESDRYELSIPILDPELREVRLFAAVTRGPSMNRRYPEGTIVVFTDDRFADTVPTPGKRYIVERIRRDGMREATIKQLWQDADGTQWLLPDSDDPRFQEPIPLTGKEGEQIHIIGTVVYAIVRG